MVVRTCCSGRSEGCYGPFPSVNLPNHLEKEKEAVPRQLRVGADLHGLSRGQAVRQRSVRKAAESGQCRTAGCMVRLDHSPWQTATPLHSAGLYCPKTVMNLTAIRMVRAWSSSLLSGGAACACPPASRGRCRGSSARPARPPAGTPTAAAPAEYCPARSTSLLLHPVSPADPPQRPAPANNVQFTGETRATW